MEKFILVNLINPKRRFSDHCYPSSVKKDNSLIDIAIFKYGKENFSLEILGFYEDYNQKEKDFILLYNSKAPNGYNILDGGNEPPIKKGEENPFSIISKETAEKIKDMLEDYNIPLKNIFKELNVSRDVVRHINDGSSWNDSFRTYPIRPNEKIIQEQKVNQIKELLKTTSLSQKEIAEKFGFKRSFVTMINIGKNWYDEEENYPIRKTNKEKAEEIKKLLISTELSKAEIARQIKVSYSFVDNISSGKTWKDDNLNYPLR